MPLSVAGELTPTTQEKQVLWVPHNVEIFSSKFI